ncbi:hypothetical protein ILYODFUR_026434 [Ilyodon furcidens]|uniref:Uncharacterized protein n=1 Tax=Ilyodon furcidens TaxID=33524 RepID=A0ABV0VHD4_9TELE
MSGGQQEDGRESEKFQHSAERRGRRGSAADHRLSPRLPGWKDEGGGKARRGREKGRGRSAESPSSQPGADLWSSGAGEERRRGLPKIKCSKGLKVKN